MDLVERLGSKVLSDLCFLNASFTEFGLHYSLIGATALLVHLIDLSRTTQDLDVAVAIRKDFKSAIDELVSRGFRTTKTPHRLLSPKGTQVDILPVTSESRKTGVISWPDGTTMTAVGLAEALDRALDIRLPECAIRVAPLPVLAALKLLASTSLERYGKDDLNDFLECLEQYELQGERRFSVYDLTKEELSFDQAGAFLLEHELKSVAHPSTMQSVHEALAAMSTSSLESMRTETQERMQELVRGFRLGLG